MRKLFLVLLSAVMLMGTLSGAVSAQNDDATPEAKDSKSAKSSAEGTAYADGIDVPATYFSERGDPLATITVTEVERGWEEYAEFYEPKPGVEYVAVTIEVEVLSKRNLILEPYGLSMIDSFGRNTSRSYAEADKSSKINVLTEDLAIASGEKEEVTVIFEIYEDADMGFLMWQPDSGIIVMVNLADEN